eukprot:gene22458-29573_t
MDHESNDSHESLVAAQSTDVARTVFSFAPYWACSVSWHCQHPSDTSGSSFIHFSEPQTSEEALQQYRNRQMKGSNLFIGLSSPDIALDKIPPTFYRTLAYVFEIAKSGQTYTPLTEADVQRGCPAKGWCEPLWNRSLRTSGQGDILTNPSTAPQPAVADPAAVLFSCAPFWAAEQMLELHRLGGLPPWTPVLGLRLDVSTFNSLPPSLFMPLGALLHLASMGLPCKAVGMEELAQWDKFKGSRTSYGTTPGVLQSVSSRPSRGQPAQALGSVPSSETDRLGGPTHSSQNSLQRQGSMPRQGGPTSLPPFYPPHQQPSGGFFNPNTNSYSPYPVYGTPFGAPNPSKAPPPQHMMWGYSQYPPVAGGPPPYLQANPSPTSAGFGPGSYPPAASYNMEHANQPNYNPQGGQWQAQLGERQSRNNKKGRGVKGSGLKKPVLHSGQPNIMAPPRLTAPGQAMGHGQDTQSAAGSGRVWDTALFRLFTADATRGPAAAAWWRTPVGNSGVTEGPIGGEQMIIEYCQGRVLDSQLVCGTTADVTVNLTPPRDLFENVGSLLQQVEQGGHYVLVSLQEIQNASRGNPSSHSTGRPSGSGVMLEENSLGPKLSYWCSSSEASLRCSHDGAERDSPPYMKHSIDGTIDRRDQLGMAPRLSGGMVVAKEGLRQITNKLG